jgi:hypothetical protein
MTAVTSTLKLDSSQRRGFRKKLWCRGAVDGPDLETGQQSALREHEDAELVPVFVPPLMIRQRAETGTGIREKVDAGATTSTTRYDAKTVNLGKMLARGRLAVFKEPPKEVLLF